MIEVVKVWFTEHPSLSVIIKAFTWIVLILLVITWIKLILKKRLPDNSIRYKSQKGVQTVGYILVIFIAVTYFTGNIKDLGLTIGFLTAGITITLQEIILSVAGSFYIFLARVYKPGDRIEINGIKGDVIDIDSVYTTMMEIGEWVSSDNYSGRIVKLSNAFVFKGPVYNYSQDFPFVWDEFNVPVKYGSDVDLTREIVMSVAQEYLTEYIKESVSDWKHVVEKYYIEDAQVEPGLAITMTDNWMQFNLRYIVDYKKRRYTKNLLQEAIVKRIQQTQGKVLLATATFEIVGFPAITIKDERTTGK
ncbi:MAG: mechanosensitive ion channel [Bacteroidetes bacterium]|nr:mechanosensitive ion channel [Bacteroidota bacterium]